MTCQEFIRFLEAMPLRERTSIEMEQIHQHARECLSCAGRLLDASRLEDQLSNLALVRPSADLATHVMRRLRPAPAASPLPASARRGGLFSWVAGLIAAVAALLVCLYPLGLTAWLKQLAVPHLGPQFVPSLRQLPGAEPAQWALGLAALLIGIAMLAEREKSEVAGRRVGD